MAQEQEHGEAGTQEEPESGGDSGTFEANGHAEERLMICEEYELASQPDMTSADSANQTREAMHRAREENLTPSEQNYRVAIPREYLINWDSSTSPRGSIPPSPSPPSPLSSEE